ncbi:glutamine synthetase 2 [Perilla frutescens var. frutescens]|nr:glutamine synthetase 2 [Perilla frutescens var. frutescens]
MNSSMRSRTQSIFDKLDLMEKLVDQIAQHYTQNIPQSSYRPPVAKPVYAPPPPIIRPLVAPLTPLTQSASPVQPAIVTQSTPLPELVAEVEEEKIEINVKVPLAVEAHVEEFIDVATCEIIVEEEKVDKELNLEDSVHEESTLEVDQTLSEEEKEVYPQAIFKDPFSGDNNILVICDTYTPAGEPISTNKRYRVAQIFSGPKVVAEVPW